MHDVCNILIISLFEFRTQAMFKDSESNLTFFKNPYYTFCFCFFISSHDKSATNLQQQLLWINNIVGVRRLVSYRIYYYKRLYESSFIDKRRRRQLLSDRSMRLERKKEKSQTYAACSRAIFINWLFHGNRVVELWEGLNNLNTQVR